MTPPYSHSKVTFSSPLRYRGNLFFLIMFLLIFFPLGVMLALKNSYFLKDAHRYSLKYYGDWFWPLLLSILFFPLAYVLLFFKGFGIVQEPADFYG